MWIPGGKKGRQKKQKLSCSLEMWISGKRQITAKICVCDRQNASLALENANVRLDFQCLQAKDFVTSTTDYFLC